MNDRNHLVKRDYHVLIVDDEPAVLSSLALMLETVGCAVEKTESGIAALDLLKASATDFDCILLDYSMPNMNGLTALQKIRSLDINTPVILSSGISFSEKESESFEHWPEGVLSKPFRLDQLLTSLDNVCAKS